ncbi:MAG TPA: hypothetical protein VKR30_00480 [Candidatus Limnocylindrales bacterium]|nr:hypothetical protein [Candidatus Limnocylindrales bacterium]
MGIVAWIILGVAVGYLAGLLVDDEVGFGSHAALGVIGALAGGFLDSAAFGTSPTAGIDLGALVVAAAGAVVTIVVWNAATGVERPRRGTRYSRRG